ncbi:SNARE-associated protein Snapin [Biomphalaria glabrata]|uniref:Biogenesis of lysosome-related organelles complex 1 subunit 7 n=2 Tax=Biomphalaria TaxID=6525 RepID=A0A2C9M3G3_BIOGL|nr:SNARE-associated protein Snapin-like [Biomphalaria glabrata]KAI8748657.1 SNARE-associated protein Snapin-like [Biomphalaria glabrata]KAI8770977.1 SNARE-associated protein Snapin [Biomphalaria glabrata]KAK0065688.1 SNARE-associated protein Snapin [Biomphalaria pfeifferi]
MSVLGEKPLDHENRDAIARGLVDLLKPAVDEIDERVKCVRESQVELRQKIDSLCEDLKKISENDPVPIELEPYVKKLNSSRRRVMLVNSILQNVQDRLTKLHNNISKETARRKTMLDPSSPSHQK